MARLALITSLVISIFMLAGCGSASAGKAQGTAAGPTIDVAKTSEADLVKHLAAGRQTYRQGVETMIKYYTKTGNNMKLTWAQKELAALNAIPQYKYIAETTVDTGKAGSAPGPTVDVAKTGEADLAEQLAASRQAYRQIVEAMIKYYTKTGNNMKLNWAKSELNSLNAIPQNKYIVEATAPGSNLKAAKTIAEADTLYGEAVKLEESARFLFLKNESQMRQALDKYNQLINKYPTSDKIDDAAFRAAGIYEQLGDYKLAILYYQRTYQWNPETSSPARFKAAFIFDRQFHQRDEALKLYQDALQRITMSDEHRQWRELAEQRVKELQGESKPKQ
jgi:tetratricopeptide (TPR) repeat protein